MKQTIATINISVIRMQTNVYILGPVVFSSGRLMNLFYGLPYVASVFPNVTSSNFHFYVNFTARLGGVTRDIVMTKHLQHFTHPRRELKVPKKRDNVLKANVVTPTDKKPCTDMNSLLSFTTGPHCVQRTTFTKISAHVAYHVR